MPSAQVSDVMQVESSRRVAIKLELGEEIYVEVYRTNETGKTLLHELPEPEESSAA